MVRLQALGTGNRLWTSAAVASLPMIFAQPHLPMSALPECLQLGSSLEEQTMCAPDELAAKGCMATRGR